MRHVGYALLIAIAWSGLLLSSLTGEPAGHESELEACRRLAPKYEAEVEVRLWDGTRCDLVTETEAIEVDWAQTPKWAEAIGQAQYYGITLGKRPAVLLLVRDLDREMRYVHRCAVVCAKLDMRLYVEEAD